MAVVLALALANTVTFFFLRRRRRNTPGSHSVPIISDDTAKKSELDTDKHLPVPTSSQNGDIKPHVQPSELSAVSSPQELPTKEREKSRVAKVDDRAAAGCDSAHRGN